jgi:hypothetical protein
VTSFRYYDTDRGAFLEADEDLSRCFVTLTFRHESAPGVFQYPRKFDVSLGEAHRLGALAAKSKAAPVRVLSAPADPHVTGYGKTPEPTRGPVLLPGA